MVEEHWPILLWPWELKSLQNSFVFRNSILKGSFVKSHRWEIAESWVHPVLDLESNWSDSKADQPLKKTLVESCFRRFLAHDNRAKLAMVTHKDHMFGPFQNRNQSFRLRCLRSFINEHLLEFDRLEPLVECRYTSSADHIGVSNNLVFSLPLKVLKNFIILFVELTIFISLRHQFLHPFELIMFQVLNLLM